MYLYVCTYIRICIYVHIFICMSHHVQCRREQKVMQLSFVAQTRLFLFVGRYTFRAKISSGFSGGSSVNVPSGLIHLTLFIVYTADHTHAHTGHTHARMHRRRHEHTHRNTRKLTPTDTGEKAHTHTRTREPHM